MWLVAGTWDVVCVLAGPGSDLAKALSGPSPVTRAGAGAGPRQAQDANHETGEHGDTAQS